MLLSIGFSKTTSAQFTGCYAASNWTVTNSNTNGFVYTTNSYFDIIADTDQNGNGTTGLSCGAGNGNVRTCIIVPANGTISFSWYWTGGNNATLLSEPFGYCLNGVATDVTANVNYAGSESVTVAQGDNFCFCLSSQLANSHPTLFTHVNVFGFSGPCSPSAVSNLSIGSTISIAPAFTNTLTIEGTTAGATLEVYNAIGKEVIRTNTSAGATILNTVNFNPGIYVFRYLHKNKSWFARSIKV